MADIGTRRHTGDLAEELVTEFLRTEGFVVLFRNLRLGRLEIDIVALEGRTVCVVEVRARGQTSLTTGLSSIGWQKALRLRRAGQRLWDRRFRNDARVDGLRYDIASVSIDAGGARIEYVRAALPA